MNEIIKIDAVTKSWGSVVGVDDVSFSVKEGEFVTLLGPSGCGKSTLLRMIGGFETPTDGRIWLDGEDVSFDPPNKRAVNMVFQDYALFPHMSVGRNVAYGLRVAGVSASDREARAIEALDLVGLADKANNMPHELSGGQRQRVALARAIVRKPKVLLLDEPLSALDANLREEMQVELRRLHTKVGLTFIMVTHDQDEALAMADRVIVMRAGSVIQDGTPDELYDQPNSPYVAGFIGATNLFTSQVSGNTVDCFGQVLELPNALTAQSGGTFGFRPEKVRLLAANEPAGPNVLTGTVREVLYHGASARMVVALGGGEITATCPIQTLSGRKLLPPEGSTVRLEVPSDRLMHFAQEAAE